MGNFLLVRESDDFIVSYSQESQSADGHRTVDLSEIETSGDDQPDKKHEMSGGTLTADNVYTAPGA